MNTTTDKLTDAMRAHCVTAWLEAFEGIETRDSWEHRAWRFALDIDGEMILRRAPYSTGMGLSGEPTPADFFGAILSDCASIEGYADLPAEDAWIEWASDLGLFTDWAVRKRPSYTASIRKARDDYREIAARRALLIEHLGEDTYREFIEIAQDL